MLWILFGLFILVAVITFFVSLIIIFSEENLGRGIRMLLVMLVAVGLSIGCFHGINGICNMRYEEITPDGEWPLISLQDQSKTQIQGSGCLFYVKTITSSLDEYVFYYQLENGGYKQGRVDSTRATIFEQEEGIPKLVDCVVNLKSDIPKWLDTLLTFGYGSESYYVFELYVPKGTVLRDFEIDLE